MIEACCKQDSWQVLRQPNLQAAIITCSNDSTLRSIGYTSTDSFLLDLDGAELQYFATPRP